MRKCQEYHLGAVSHENSRANFAFRKDGQGFRKPTEFSYRHSNETLNPFEFILLLHRYHINLHYHLLIFLGSMINQEGN